ncbi:hypothetical protein ILYODFUR_029870 [Ilyodon furcidens]|uniref:Uncharacterized protein n=1 Tax=Ilyodon furcidens TaxID=33524 RepID=A0ABV0TDM9_9TELE
MPQYVILGYRWTFYKQFCEIVTNSLWPWLMRNVFFSVDTSQWSYLCQIQTLIVMTRHCSQALAWGHVQAQTQLSGLKPTSNVDGMVEKDGDVSFTLHPMAEIGTTITFTVTFNLWCCYYMVYRRNKVLTRGVNTCLFKGK